MIFVSGYLEFSTNWQRLRSSLLTTRYVRSSLIAVFFISVILMGTTSNAGEQLSAREIASIAKSAVVTVNAHKNDEVIGLGSGFFIREDGVLVTNLHVVQNADSLSVEVSSGEIFDKTFVLATDERRDLILLQVPVSDTSFLTVGDDRSTEVGDTVYVVGNPLGLSGTFSDGLISAKRIENGVTYLQISAPISEGSSGGPVLDTSGRAIAVATLTSSEGQNLNAAVPARYANDILKLAGEPVPFAAIAVEFATTDAVTVDQRHRQTAELLDLLTDEARAEIEEMDPYLGQVSARLIAFSAFAYEAAWRETDYFEISSLKSGKIGSFKATLDTGSYMALGVCDDDCTDMDIYVLDKDGEIYASDESEDADSIVQFSIQEQGLFYIGTKMYECNAGDCLYAVKLFRK